MKLFDTPDNRCYITAPPASNAKEQDRIHVVGYQKLYPEEKYPKDGFPDVCLFQEHGGRYINEFQLLYIASGAGTFQDRGIHYSLHAGHFILIQPGFWHSYSPNKETGWEEYYIGFNGPILSSLAHELYKINDINLLRVNNTEFILPLFETILRTGCEAAPDSQLILKALLTQLITDIRFALKPSHSSKESLLFKARQFMEENLSNKISIDDIAHHLGVSNSWFRREFYNETGVPPATYLGRVRLQTSKYILLSSEKSIKEIATECGFSTTEYFCKFFKDNTGMTPSEFREQGPQQHNIIWKNK